MAGFGVTRLDDPVTGRAVWGTPHAMWQTHYEDDLDLDPNDRLVPGKWVGSRGPVNIGWQLSIALQKYGGYREDVDLYAFRYDWRRSARDNARLLGALVDRVRNGGEVDIVAHSAGALVSLAYVKLTGAPHVNRLVLIAPPLHGTLEAFRVFARPERFLRRTFTPATIATWPSLFELLPDDGRVFVDEQGHSLDADLWDANTWKIDVAQQLANARAFRDELRNTPTNVPITIIAGDCVPTTRRVLRRRDKSFVFYPGDLRDDERALTNILFEPGDGTVPLSSTGATQIFCDGHQGIAADPSVHRAIIRALRF